MPNRTVRDTICADDRLDALSPGAERLYHRLHSQADDYGALDGRLQVVRSRCFQLCPESVTLPTVEKWLSEVAAAGLILLYEVAGRPYLQMLDWPYQARAISRKYPPPNLAEQVRTDAAHVQADASHLCADGEQMQADAERAPADAERLLPDSRYTVHGTDSRKEQSTYLSPGGSESERPQPPDPLPITPQRVSDLWNEICAPALPAVSTMTDQRRQHVKARLAVKPPRDETWWRAYFERIAKSPFCQGGGRDGWRANFDWAVRSEQVVAGVHEGKYDGGRVNREPARASGGRPAGYYKQRAAQVGGSGEPDRGPGAPDGQLPGGVAGASGFGSGLRLVPRPGDLHGAGEAPGERRDV